MKRNIYLFTFVFSSHVEFITKVIIYRVNTTPRDVVVHLLTVIKIIFFGGITDPASSGSSSMQQQRRLDGIIVNK